MDSAEQSVPLQASSDLARFSLAAPDTEVLAAPVSALAASGPGPEYVPVGIQQLHP